MTFTGIRFCIAIVLTALLFISSLFSCRESDSITLQPGGISYSFKIHPTAVSLSPELSDSLFPEGGAIDSSEKRLHLLPLTDRPVGGTVSHHLLAAEEIEHWFWKLASYGDIDTFIIISPAHWVTEGAVLKITDLPWDAGFAQVDCDIEAAAFLSGSSPLVFENGAFHLEHGIGSLIPYIAAYFPGSRVVPILQIEEKLDTGGLSSLARAIQDLKTLNPETRYFIIISADFSHHAGIETTRERDSRTESVLPTLSGDNLPLMYSDNRGGLLVLSKVLSGEPDEYQLVEHTNSFRISGMDKEDITSYFFTLYW